MHIPKLTQLQSRFAASFIASAILVLIFFTLTRPEFAYAVELDSRIPPDHNHPIILDTPFDDYEEWTVDAEDLLLPRAPVGVSALANNDPQNQNIDGGETQTWVFPQEVINGPHGVLGPGLPSIKLPHEGETSGHSELKKRQIGQIVYITANTCLQPSAINADPATHDAIPPQLTLSVNTSNNLQSVDFSGGYAIVKLTAIDDVYFNVSAPNSTAFSGIWNYEIAASIDAPYHSIEPTTPNLYFVDGDNHAALLITNDTTTAPSNSSVYQHWMSMPPPWGMFGHGEKDHSILGVQQSYCGLVNYAKIVANLQNVQNQNVATMVNRGTDAQPKEQFYIPALNASSTYWGFLAMQGNSTASGKGVVGGGGIVYQKMNFTTKAGDNCALMYNLSFCSDVAYAVPTNPQLFSPSTGLQNLSALYDSYAANYYTSFTYALAQIPCNTTASAQYSLAVTCDDCASAYKQWLCAVTIPRCEDFSNTAPFLKPRNVAQKFANGSTLDFSDPTNQILQTMVSTNASRNPNIDALVMPGPYKEVLPCADMCYNLVRSCPAALGFGCPLRGRGLEESYGPKSNDSGIITCNYPGALYYRNGVGRLFGSPSRNVAMAVSLVVGLLLL